MKSAVCKRSFDVRRSRSYDRMASFWPSYSVTGCSEQTGVSYETLCVLLAYGVLKRSLSSPSGETTLISIHGSGREPTSPPGPTL